MNKTNYHSHTIRCKHAKGSDEEYVLSAIKGGFSELGFSDHSPWPFDKHYISGMRMSIEELNDYVSSIRKLQEKYDNQITLKIGLECEYFEEYILWLKAVVEEYRLDYLIFGNHFSSNEQGGSGYGKMETDQLALEAYLDTAIKGMESGLFAYFAHPDIFVRAYGTFDEVCERVSRNICEKAKELDLLLEYNISSYILEPQKDIYSYPSPNFWKIASEIGCRCIIGYDAHVNYVYETDDYLKRALKDLEQLKIEVVNTIPFIQHQL